MWKLAVPREEVTVVEETKDSRIRVRRASVKNFMLFSAKWTRERVGGG